MKHLVRCLVLLPALGAFAPASAQEAATSKPPVIIPSAETAYPEGVGKVPAVVSQCLICHGPNGVTQIPEWPNIAGQKKDYLLKQMKLVKSGERKDPLGMMKPIMSLLSDEQMAEAAEYFSKQPASVWTAPEAAAPEVAELMETCVSCHNPDEEGDAALWPHIEGQKKPYLHEQLIAFRDGQRVDETMSPMAADLTDEQIDQLVEYLGQNTASAAAN